MSMNLKQFWLGVAIFFAVIVASFVFPSEPAIRGLSVSFWTLMAIWIALSMLFHLEDYRGQKK